MPRQNYLLGKGEQLTEQIRLRSGGGPKEAPYTFQQAQARLAPMLNQAVFDLDALPADACPHDEAVISLVLNPEYIAKSYYPNRLFQDVGIEIIGSRPKRVTPEKRSLSRDLIPALTTESSSGHKSIEAILLRDYVHV